MSDPESMPSLPGQPVPAGTVSIAGTGESPIKSRPKRRVAMVVAIVLEALLGVGACVTFGVYRLLAGDSESTSAMRGFVETAYPDYQVIDSTRSGYILKHNDYESLRIDVRFVHDEMIGVWEEAPVESLTDGWSTVETFFRHAEGMEPDPRTGMNYDVAGFVEEYEPLRPGPNAVVSAVWLEDTDAAGIETYVVLVARRNRQGSYVEGMWPDHAAYFTRDPETGEWTGTEFEPVEIDNPNR